MKQNWVLDTSLVPRRREPGIHCLRMRLITTIVCISPYTTVLLRRQSFRVRSICQIFFVLTIDRLTSLALQRVGCSAISLKTEKRLCVVLASLRKISNSSAAFSRCSGLRKPYTCTATPSRSVILPGSLCFIAVWLNRLTIQSLGGEELQSWHLSHLDDRSYACMANV